MVTPGLLDNIGQLISFKRKSLVSQWFRASQGMTCSVHEAYTLAGLKLYAVILLKSDLYRRYIGRLISSIGSLQKLS